MTRTPDEVRRDIDRERIELQQSVDELRGQAMGVLPKVAAGFVSLIALRVVRRRFKRKQSE